MDMWRRVHWWRVFYQGVWCHQHHQGEEKRHLRLRQGEGLQGKWRCVTSQCMTWQKMGFKPNGFTTWCVMCYTMVGTALQTLIHESNSWINPDRSNWRLCLQGVFCGVDLWWPGHHCWEHKGEAGPFDSCFGTAEGSLVPRSWHDPIWIKALTLLSKWRSAARTTRVVTKTKRWRTSCNASSAISRLTCLWTMRRTGTLEPRGALFHEMFVYMSVVRKVTKCTIPIKSRM